MALKENSRTVFDFVKAHDGEDFTAQDIADATGVVKENVPFEEAKEAQAKFEEAGAKVELK